MTFVSHLREKGDEDSSVISEGSKMGDEIERFCSFSVVCTSVECGLDSQVSRALELC